MEEEEYNLYTLNSIHSLENNETIIALVEVKWSSCTNRSRLRSRVFDYKSINKTDKDLQAWTKQKIHNFRRNVCESTIQKFTEGFESTSIG